MQIRTRLTYQFIFSVALIIIFSFSIIYYSSYSYRKNEYEQRLLNKAIITSKLILDNNTIDYATLKIIDDADQDHLVDEIITIYSANQKLIYTNNKKISLHIKPNFLKDVEKVNYKKFTLNELEIIAKNYKVKPNNFYVIAGGYDKYGKSKLRNLRNTLIALFSIIISIVAITGWLYSGRALRPLNTIIKEVDSLNIDKLDERLNKHIYNDEIGRLINTFNTLLARIEHVFNLQKIFVSGASHELKNPLTSITSQLQVVLLSDRTGEEYKKIIESILEDIKVLNKTTLDLIEFVKLNYEGEIILSKIRIDDTLWSVKDYFSKNHSNYNVITNFGNLPEDEQTLIVNGNEALLKVALINLIENACKFSEDETAKVSFMVNDSSVKIKIEDNGIGLEESEKLLIFEPFYRANSTAEKKGHGIGLALVKKIIEFHEAKIELISEKNKGTTFILTFSNHIS